MTCGHTKRCRNIALAALLLAQTATATTVYRSVDANGVVVFSDTRPDQHESVQTLEIDTPAATSDGLLTERLQAMRESTDRLAAERRAREKHRAELRLLADQKQDHAPAPRDARYDAPDIDLYLPDYFGHSAAHRRPHYNGPRRQRSPIAAPNSGARFNDYPASLIRKGYDPRAREAFSQ